MLDDSSLRKINEHKNLQRNVNKAVEVYFGRCPCCLVNMSKTILPFQQVEDNARTKGHVLPSTYKGFRAWVWQCFRCNQDQRYFTLMQWSRHLSVTNDKRWVNVYSLILLLRQLGINVGD